MYFVNTFCEPCSKSVTMVFGIKSLLYDSTLENNRSYELRILSSI